MIDTMTVAGPRTSLTANDDASTRRVLNSYAFRQSSHEMDSTNGSWIRIAIAAFSVFYEWLDQYASERGPA